MPQSLAQVYLHVVFSTKDRLPYLEEEETRQRVHAYLAGVCKNLGAPALKIGGVADHVHIACRFPSVKSIAEFIRELKRDSSKWTKQLSPELGSFFWQKGYGAFSVSPIHVPALIRYIECQEEHHREESFQDEFRRICKKYGVELDELYAWD